MLRQSDFSLFFVIDPPALLLDSVILVSTARYHLPDVELVAYCPDAKREFVPAFLKELYSSLNVDLRFLPPASFSPHYKQGNKILAACQSRKPAQSIFLDTDIAIGRNFDLNDMAKPGHVGVVPEGIFTWGKPQSLWSRVYAMFDMDVPDERVTLSRSNLQSIPYFNAGVVSFPSNSSFAEMWMETANAIDGNDEIRHRRPWLDQIALPLAITRSGMSAHVMEPGFNLSLSRNLDKPHLAARDVLKMNATDGRVIHYHDPVYIEGTRYAADIDKAISTFTKYPGAAALTQQTRDRRAEAARVWRVFDSLKKKKRTEEEDVLFREARQRKSEIKASRINTVAGLSRYPATILPSG